MCYSLFHVSKTKGRFHLKIWPDRDAQCFQQKIFLPDPLFFLSSNQDKDFLKNWIVLKKISCLYCYLLINEWRMVIDFSFSYIRISYQIIPLCQCNSNATFLMGYQKNIFGTTHTRSKLLDKSHQVNKMHYHYHCSSMLS